MTTAALNAKVRVARTHFAYGTDGMWYWCEPYSDAPCKFWTKLRDNTAVETLDVVRDLRSELGTSWATTLEIVRQLASAPVAPASFVGSAAMEKIPEPSTGVASCGNSQSPGGRDPGR